MIDIGKLDSRCEFQRATDAVDAQGSVSKTWAALVTVWCAAKADQSAGEFLTGNIMDGSQIYVFTVRQRASLADLTIRDRIVWKAKNHNIISIQPLPEGRPDKIQITAQRAA